MSIKVVQLATDLVTVAEFKDHAGSYLDRIQSSGQPLVITKNGKAAGVVLSPADFDRIQYQIAFMESVARGLADGDAGRVRSTEELQSELRSFRTQKKDRE